uniref:DUF6821 domain-containing protein n=1 Tax=Leersia perrieri TaxID=77586 RepID=A0A0D9X0N8_9ORYZ
MRTDEADADEFVLVADAYTASYRDHEPRVRVLAGGYSDESIDANYFAAAKPHDAYDNDEVEEAVAANASDVESGDADDDDEVVIVEEQEQTEGDHGWQQHAVGVLCSVGLAAATAAGMALLLGGGGGHGRHKPMDAVKFRVAGDYKAAKVSARRDARVDQGISVAPAVISFAGCKT